VPSSHGRAPWCFAVVPPRSSSPGWPHPSRWHSSGGAALAGGQVEHFDLRGAANRPYSIVDGPDGNLWFTKSDGNAIGPITPDGTLKRFLLPTEGSKLYGITVG